MIQQIHNPPSPPVDSGRTQLEDSDKNELLVDRMRQINQVFENVVTIKFSKKPISRDYLAGRPRHDVTFHYETIDDESVKMFDYIYEPDLSVADSPGRAAYEADLFKFLNYRNLVIPAVKMRLKNELFETVDIDTFNAMEWELDERRDKVRPEFTDMIIELALKLFEEIPPTIEFETFRDPVELPNLRRHLE